MTATLVFKNTIPPQSKTDSAYLAQLSTLREAVRGGAKIHVVLEYGTDVFLVDIPTMKIEADYASGLIHVRSPIDNDARVIRANGLVAGSVDTFGNYRYGQYLFGSDTWTTSMAGAQIADSPGYTISWYAT